MSPTTATSPRSSMSTRQRSRRIVDAHAHSCPTPTWSSAGSRVRTTRSQRRSVSRTGSSARRASCGGRIHRLLRLKLETGRPIRWLFLENVDRLLKSPASQRGRDFAVMLASLADLGYEVEWRVINAAEYGFPQKRRRVFIVGRYLGFPGTTRRPGRRPQGSSRGRSRSSHKLASTGFPSTWIRTRRWSVTRSESDAKRTAFGNAGVMRRSSTGEALQSGRRT